ncbi:STAS domain-containing protein [Methylobacterium terricola]|uniref:STAS domain-containing protein n=1 Tax=Methylobacterium terricola TaxID=2583531 RepID=A0A5C4L7J6_9HYPH|nr:STAS domain-containing protein [Methylobacterium terricola]TNC05781.1 STAS domain-containing protein [Methylobacterium terricola]
MSEPFTVTLRGDCTVRTIGTLHGEVAAALASTTDLALDCAAVERADIAFVQLVVAAAGTAERQARRLTLVDAPEVVRSAFARAGLSAQAPFRHAA